MKRKSRIVLSIASICATIGLAAVATSCQGSYKMTDFIVEGATVDKEYYVGDTVDFSDVVMYAQMSDDTKKDVLSTQVKFYLDGVDVTSNLSVITQTVGTKVLKIEYTEGEVTDSMTFTLTVTQKPQESPIAKVLLNADNVKKNYEIGDTNVSLDGLTVTATRENGNSFDVALSDVSVYLGEEKITDFSQITNSSGNKAISVWYQGKYSENFFTIEVSNPAVGISLKTESVKVEYNYAETGVTFAGLEVWENYKNSTDKASAKVDLAQVTYKVGETDITENLDALTQTLGEKTVVVSYKDFTANFTVNVINYITEVSVDTEGVELQYFVDDTLALDGVKVNVIYAETSENKELNLQSEGVTCTYNGNAVVWENLTATAGDKVITVTYGDKSATFTVMVREGETIIDSLTVTAPTTSEYVAGTTVSLDGMTITAKYKEAGYEDQTIVFADFAANDVVLYLNNEVLTDYNKIAQQTAIGTTDVVVQVKYEGKFADFTIKVTNSVKSISLNTDNVKTSYKYGETVSYAGLVVTAECDYLSQEITNDKVTFMDGETAITDWTLVAKVVGTKELTVSYEGKTATYEIEVSNYVTALALADDSTTNFTFHLNTADKPETLDFTGLKLNATYANGDTAVLDHDDVSYIYGNSEYTYETLEESNLLTVPGGKQLTMKADDVTTSSDNYISVIVNNIVTGITAKSEKYDGETYLQTTKNSIVEIWNIKLELTRAYGDYLTVDLGVLNKDENGKIINFSLSNSVNLFWNKSETKDVDISNEWDILSSEEGTHTVTIQYTDINGFVSETTIKIYIGQADTAIDTLETPTAMQHYQNAIKNVTDDDTTAAEGRFFTSDNSAYKVGDDNNFKFLPIATVVLWDVGGYVLSAFEANSEISIKVEDAYVTLTKKQATETGIYQYSYNDTLYVTEYSLKNEYKFESVSVGKDFKISVKPSEKYTYDGSAVSCDITIVDGFNIDDVKELSVIDNAPETERNHWNNLKAELGLTGIDPASVIFHNDLVITANDLPESMKYTIGNDYPLYYSYKDANNNVVSVTPEEVPAEFGGPLTRTFLWNGMDDGTPNIYKHFIPQGGSFTIYGNYFNLDASKLPLVASFEALGVDGDTYYGGDFSNTTLIYIHGQTENTASGATFRMENLSATGNANTYQLDTYSAGDKKTYGYKGDKPVYAGGTIFIKTGEVTAEFENVIAKTFFISYFPEWYAKVNYTKTKSFDSYQNAMYIWGNADVTVSKSYYKRAGGPLMIMNHVDPEEENDNIPQITITEDCAMESKVTGQETWFATVGGSAIITQLQALDAMLFNSALINKTIYKKDSNGVNKFNIISLLMRDATNAEETLKAYQAQGRVSWLGKNAELNRMKTSELGLSIMNYLAMSASMGSSGITLNFGSEMFFLYPDGSGNLQLARFNEQYQPVWDAEVQQAFAMAAIQSNYVSLNYGGIGLLLGLESL